MTGSPDTSCDASDMLAGMPRHRAFQVRNMVRHTNGTRRVFKVAEALPRCQQENPNDVGIFRRKRRITTYQSP